MTPGQPQPKLQLANTADYRESYANSVQMRVNLWDFFLLFGTINQTAPGHRGYPELSGRLLEPTAGQGAIQRAATEFEAV